MAATRVDIPEPPTFSSVGSRLACASLARAQATAATRETAAAAGTEVGIRSGFFDMAHIPSDGIPIDAFPGLINLRAYIRWFPLHRYEVDHTAQ
jgi:hypothetical protein